MALVSTDDDDDDDQQHSIQLAQTTSERSPTPVVDSSTPPHSPIRVTFGRIENISVCFCTFVLNDMRFQLKIDCKALNTIELQLDQTLE